MCGFFGILRTDGLPLDLGQAAASLELIRHRGPDDEGWLLVNTNTGVFSARAGKDTLAALKLPALQLADATQFDVALGFRRLAIIDVGEAGHQPMSTRDGKLWVLFNGEIYNYLELRSELETKGHAFRTQSDTEVLLAAYQEWGPAAVERFMGMFAIVIVDISQRTFFFARDPFGIKPLYFTRIPGGILFGSEIQSLLAYPEVDRRVDPQKLFDYLRFGMVDGTEDTLLRHIKEFPAASWALLPFGSDSLELNTYWEVDIGVTNDIGAEEAASLILDELDRSVRLHLRSDVPIGTCLSGGLDSTAILMLMRSALGDGYPIEAFSFITQDPVLSEKRFVEIASQAARVNLHCVEPTPGEFAEDMADLIRCQGFPFGGPSVYAQYRVFRLAKESGITVMLDGQGADEMLGGYYNHIGAKLTSLISGLQFIKALRVLGNTPGNMSDHFLRMLIFSFGRLLPDFARSRFRGFVGDSTFPSWLNRDWFNEHGVMGSERSAGRGRNALKEELAIAMSQGSLSELLRYEDRNSMRHSIESRVPFCNPKLAKLAMSLPSDSLISQEGVTKAVLKAAMRGIVPDKIIDREKVGFGTPEREWLRGIRPFIISTLEEGAAMDIPYFRDFHRPVLKAIDTHGRWPAHAWRILNLILWIRQFEVSND